MSESGFMKNMTEKITQIQTAIKTILSNEMGTDGLLNDVEEVYTSRKINANELDYPCIWVIDNNIEAKESGLGPRSIETDACTVGFFCLDYDDTDPEESNLLSRNLALRVVDTLEKYCLITDDDGEKVFDYVKFLNLEPVDFPISSANTITQYGVTFEFGFRRQRSFCNYTINNE